LHFFGIDGGGLGLDCWFRKDKIRFLLFVLQISRVRRATYIEMYEQNLPPISLADMDVPEWGSEYSTTYSYSEGKTKRVASACW